MKKYIIVILLIYSGLTHLQAQTAIGKREVSSQSAVLDFASGTSKGIILSAVETLPTTPSNGTFLFDNRTSEKKVKMYENGAWVALSGTGSSTAIVPYTSTTDTGKQTVMGSQSTSVDGVLVLESANKAMVLPHIVNPHINVKSPYPGMMCYDKVSKSLAVFDGAVWNYWK